MIRIVFLLVLILIARLLLFHTQGGSFEYKPSIEKHEIPLITPIKTQITKNIGRILPRDEAALLMGIVFGDKANFDENYLEAVRKTGVLHVIAASGMNVSMVAGFIFGSLALFLDRKKALILATLAIFIYAAFAEFEESIVRASIMAVFAYGAALIGRQNTSILALLFAAIIMIIFSPSIITSVGFQLSFAATAGIILFDPVAKRLPQNIFVEDVTTTVSAQLTTIPILIFYFGAFSPISFLANFLILWTIPPLMILGGMAAIVSLLFQIFALPILWTALPLLLYFKTIVLLLNNYAFEINVKNMSILAVSGYYMVILASILALWKHFKIRL